MKDKRENFAKNLGVPVEAASRILIEKEKAITLSELKYHAKSMCKILDRMRQTDSDFSEFLMKDAVKFILSRHGSVDALDEISDHIESISENFLEREITNRLKDGFE